MNLLLGGSILAAFFAGSVALFAPCCIVFLFPAYLASAVKGKGWTLFRLTVVFAAGLALVILPLTLGVGLLASALVRFHTPLYLAGGVLMLGLGVLAASGRSWSLPVRAPSVERTDAGGVLALGVFSGVASSCCAPVLAGVVALSALAGSVPGSVALGLAYVMGMVFPLFLMALVWDRFRMGERRILAGHPVTVRLGRHRVATTTTNLVIGLAFWVMGGVVIALAFTGTPMAAPGFQLALGRTLSGVFAWILRAVDPVPEPVLGLGLLGFAALVGYAGLRSSPQKKESCHGQTEQSQAREETDARA